MLKNILGLILSGILIFSLASCSDSPTSIGSNLIPGDDNVQFDLLDSYKDSLSQKSSFIKDTLNLGGSSKILLGKTDFAESVMLLAYSPTVPDSILTYYKNNEVKIKEAWINMHIVYRLGDKNANYNFEVHQVRNNWNLNFDEDSLAVLQYDNNNVGSNVIMNDTLVKVDLQTSVIDEWIQYQDSTIDIVNYGLYFAPTQDTRQILGFVGTSYVQDTTQPTIHFVFEKPNDWLDTLVIIPFLNKHVVLSSIPQSDDEIFLQAGYGVHGRVFFNLSELKSASVVNKAILELTCDTLKSADGDPASDSIYVTRYADSLFSKRTSDSSYAAILTKNGNVYSGDISYFLQIWLSNNSNYGLKLELADELDAASRIVFYGSNYKDLDKRPRLKITYATLH